MIPVGLFVLGLALSQMCLAASLIFPSDAQRVPFVGEWHYYHREVGMQTSTDDVLVSLLAAKPELIFGREEGDKVVQHVDTYVDLGCGIGSSLLLVAHALRPRVAVGIEAQEQSAAMVSRTISELPPCSTSFSVLHQDLRSIFASHEEQQHGKTLDMESLRLSVDLITANPPFARPEIGTPCKDQQRLYARFELRGGVEEYLVAAKALLKPCSSTRDDRIEGGRLLLAHWHREDARVMAAALAANLVITKRCDVIMGKPSEIKPHLAVYELISPSSSTIYQGIVHVETINITRGTDGRLSERYRGYQNALEMAKRPLKRTTTLK